MEIINKGEIQVKEKYKHAKVKTEENRIKYIIIEKSRYKSNKNNKTGEIEGKDWENHLSICFDPSLNIYSELVLTWVSSVVP